MNVLEQALEALMEYDFHTKTQVAAVASLRAAIERGPVAWRHDHGPEGDGWEYYEGANCPECVALYDLSGDQP